MIKHSGWSIVDVLTIINYGPITSVCTRIQQSGWSWMVHSFLVLERPYVLVSWEDQVSTWGRTWVNRGLGQIFSASDI